MRIYWVCAWTWKASCKVNLWAIHYSSWSSVAMTLCLLGRTLRVWHDSLSVCFCFQGFLWRPEKTGLTQRYIQCFKKPHAENITCYCHLTVANLEWVQETLRVMEGWCFLERLIIVLRWFLTVTTVVVVHAELCQTWPRPVAFCYSHVIQKVEMSLF